MSELFHEGQEVEVWRRRRQIGGRPNDWRRAKIVKPFPGTPVLDPDEYVVQFLDNTRAVFNAAHIQKRTYRYDPKCGELAASFLGRLAPDWLVEELAQHIQETIDDWLSFEKERIYAAKAKESAS
jgi:hypothetical protein